MKLKHVTYEQAVVLHQLGMPVAGTCYYIPGDPVATVARNTYPAALTDHEFLLQIVSGSVRPPSCDNPFWPNWITLVSSDSCNQSSDSEDSHVETY